jgi:hypothetical protein
LYDGVVTTRRSVVHDGRGCAPGDCLRNVSSYSAAPEESAGLGARAVDGFAELTAMTSGIGLGQSNNLVAQREFHF